mmetsp:Transcript_15128/g.12853  ORF Transcript_15128/g.12853 Transcript_15128/m.12853 type:complete len:142 (+) Transcript_15128:2265-2690(+)
MHEISFGTTKQGDENDSDRKYNKLINEEDELIPGSNSISMTSLTSPNKDDKIKIFDSSDKTNTRHELANSGDHNIDKKDSSCNISFRSKLSDIGDINTLNPMNNGSSKNLSDDSDERSADNEDFEEIESSKNPSNKSGSGS